MNANAVRYRPLEFPVTRVVMREGANGVRYLRSEPLLEGYAQRLTDRLAHWAATAPQRTFIA